MATPTGCFCCFPIKSSNFLFNLMVIDTSKFVKRSGDYLMAQCNGISDAMLLGAATRYEEALSRSFKGVTPAEIPMRFHGIKRLHWSEKYDGEGCLLFFDVTMGCVLFAAPSGRARIGLKCLKRAGEALSGAGVKKALFRGELYLPTPSGKPRTGVADVTRASFSKKEGDADALAIALFDVLMLDGKDLREEGDAFETEWNKIGALFGDDFSTGVHRARGGWCRGEELGKVFEEVLGEGGEGVVVRHERERDYTKIKPRLTIDGAVLGYVEGSFDGKIGTRNLLVGLNHPTENGKTVFQSLARTGVGLDDKMAVALLERLRGLKVESPLLLNDSEGREVHFVKPSLVVELEGEDWVYQRSDGRPVKSQAFCWDEKGSSWSYAGVANFPRLVFPAIAKLRDDKVVSEGGARLGQLQVAVPLPGGTDGSLEPEVIERKVYRKGKDAVRKFVLVRRGGEEVVPFVLVFTDFSAGRKDSLKVTTEYAFVEERAQALLKARITENIKKGWELV
jgi:hypothetical protein